MWIYLYVCNSVEEEAESFQIYWMIYVQRLAIVTGFGKITKEWNWIPAAEISFIRRVSGLSLRAKVGHQKMS